ncbi:MAG: PilZ domain-containing protein [Gammaproteobacteria bacterium]|nr:PilZ domain-containing protein [Gammaproteobacteria bacterium]
MDYSEKRGFIRIKTQSKIEYRVMGSKETYYGECINLSAGGVLFTSAHNVTPGTLMEITIKPEQLMVTPLDATIKVIRTQSNSSGGYSIAGQIKDLV